MTPLEREGEQAGAAASGADEPTEGTETREGPPPLPEPSAAETGAPEPLAPPDPDGEGPAAPREAFDPKRDLLWPALVLLLPAVVLTLGSLFARELVWEGFVDKYYWGPIVHDEGYNTVNTASWAILLGALLFMLSGLMKWMRQRVDLALILGVLPYIAFGSIFRVFEDTKMIGEPWRFFFITPIIYVVITIIAVLVLLAAYRIRSIGTRLGVAKGLQLYGALLALVVALWVMLWANQPAGLEERAISFVANPLFLAASLAVAYVMVHRHAKATGSVSPALVMGATGVGVFIFAVYNLVHWHGIQPWSPIAPSDLGVSMPRCIRGALGGGVPVCENSYWVYAAAVVFPLPFVALVWWTGAWARRTTTRAWMGIFGAVTLLFLALLAGHWADLGPFTTWGMELGVVPLVVLAALFSVVAYRLMSLSRELPARSGAVPLRQRDLFQLAFTNPLNLVLVFAQMMDATMTSLGIDHFGYAEKHVVPATLIKLLGGVGPTIEAYSATLVMIPFKFAVSVLVIWAIDVYAAEDARTYPTLVNLAKMAIIIVGLGPGVRDAVRVAMGV